MPNRLEGRRGAIKVFVRVRTDSSRLAISDGGKIKAIVTLLAEPFNGGCGYEMSHATKRIEQIAISASATEAPTLFVLCRGRTGAVTPGAD